MPDLGWCAFNYVLVFILDTVHELKVQKGFFGLLTGDNK